jgi:fatty acid desaturase
MYLIQLRRTKTMIEVEDELVSKRAQAELTHATNPNIIREYEERRDMVSDMRIQMSHHTYPSIRFYNYARNYRQNKKNLSKFNRLFKH